MTRPGRRSVGWAIVLVWLVVVGAHVRREYFKPPAVRLAEGALALAPGAHFYRIHMDGQTIGLASSSMDTVPSGFTLDDQLSLEIPALGSMQSAAIRTRLDLGRSLELRRFDFHLDSDVGRFAVAGEVVADTLLAIEVGAGGDVERMQLPWDPDVVLAAALPLRLAASGVLAVGSEVGARIFDPSVLDARDVVIRVTAQDTIIVADSASYDASSATWTPTVYDTVPVWRLEESFGGVRLTSWVDRDGRLVRAESPLGFLVERDVFEIARAEWREAQADPTAGKGYGSLIEATAIAAGAALAAGDGPDALAVRLLAVELDGFDLDGGRQTLRGDTLFVAREAVSAPVSYRLPYTGGGEPAAELASTALIQARDPRVVAAAREAAGDSDDPVEVARRLNDWVYAALRKELVASVPSAVQVLEARAGDCNEHTVLYVAMARALGLPARTAVGLVHQDGRFYYHAWPEVWLDGWVAVDPTFGQFPADASHLRFLVGGLARQVELIRLIGRLELEIQ